MCIYTHFERNKIIEKIFYICIQMKKRIHIFRENDSQSINNIEATRMTLIL